MENKEVKTGSRKLLNIVILRSFAIIAVVIYHCFCPWLFSWNWIGCEYRPIYSFILESALVGRMPLFVCVSGYLFSYLYNEKGKYQTFYIFILNKIKRLLLPCLLFSMIMSVTLQGRIFYDVFFYHYHLWFLKMLFFCFMTCWIMGKYIKGKYQFLMLFLALTFIALPQIEFFAIGQFFKYYVFFYFGYLLCRYRAYFSRYIQMKGVLFFVSSIFLLLCGLMYLCYTNYPNLAYEDIIHKCKYLGLLRTIHRFYTIIFGFAIVDYFLQKHPDFCGTLFNKLNNLSYGIYLLHVFFLQVINIYFLNYFFSFASFWGCLAPFILFILVFSLSCVLTYLFKLTRIGKFLL